jgi:hypothetical protein
MMQSAANHSPRFKFPVKQGINREFGVFGPKMVAGEVEKGRLYKGFSANSLGTGKF